MCPLSLFHIYLINVPSFVPSFVPYRAHILLCPPLYSKCTPSLSFMYLVALKRPYIRIYQSYLDYLQRLPCPAIKFKQQFRIWSITWSHTCSIYSLKLHFIILLYFSCYKFYFISFYFTLFHFLPYTFTLLVLCFRFYFLSFKFTLFTLYLLHLHYKFFISSNKLYVLCFMFYVLFFMLKVMSFML